MQTPMETLKAKFGSKEKLVDSLLPSLTKREGESKDDLKKRLLKVSATKLMRLSDRKAAPARPAPKSAAKPKAKSAGKA